MLVAAMNPCPCGNLGDPSAICSCSSVYINKYAKKISGPLLDRMDIQVYVSRERISHNSSSSGKVSVAHIRKQIADARALQLQRFKGTQLVVNSEISHKNIDQYCILSPQAERLLQNAINQKHLSLRAYHKIKKIARTIADLEATEHIQEHHIAEAMPRRVNTTQEDYGPHAPQSARGSL